MYVTYLDCPDHLGYRAGTDGSVWSRWRRVGLGKGNGSAMKLGDSWKRLAGFNDTYGYPRVNLSGGRWRAIHHLVLEAFVGKCPEGMQCRHLNGVRTDNRLENLAWGTPLENQADKVRHGTNLITVRGERHPFAKLTTEKVLAIRERSSNGETYAALSRVYGVGETAIKKIATRMLWKHV